MIPTILSLGIWKDLDELRNLNKSNAIHYSPDVDKCNKYEKSYATWKKSVKRSLDWFD